MAWVLIALVAWLAVGCGVAWLIGGAAKLGDQPGNRRPRSLAEHQPRSLTLTPPARRWSAAEEAAQARRAAWR